MESFSCYYDYLTTPKKRLTCLLWNKIIIISMHKQSFERL